MNVQTPSITCPHCHTTSYNANDVAQRYCGNCHAFHDDMRNAKIQAMKQFCDAIVRLRDAGASFVHGDVDMRPDFVVGGPICYVPGSRLVLCEHCGIALYLADSQVFEKFPDLPVVCMACAARQAENEKTKN